MLRFAIVEDNINQLKNLSHMLESIFMRYDFDAQICLRTNSPSNLLKYMSVNKIDVLFIDIDLNTNMNGMQVAEEIRKTNKDCYFIFETAHFEYSLLAYRYKTFDFLSKPFTSERLEETILRLFDDIYNVPKRFIRLDSKNIIISEDEIKYIKKDGMKLIFHTDSRDYEIYSSFKKIKSKLPENFVRCHKSFIANINNITKIEFSENLVYFDTCSCDIGPKFKYNFLEAVDKYGKLK